MRRQLDQRDKDQRNIYQKPVILETFVQTSYPVLSLVYLYRDLMSLLFDTEEIQETLPRNKKKTSRSCIDRQKGKD